MAGMTNPRGVKPRRRPAPPDPVPSVTTFLVSVGSEPVLLGERQARSMISVFNPRNEPIYLGGPGVTPDIGFPVQAGGYALLDVSSEVALYATSSPASTEETPIRVLEVE